MLLKHFEDVKQDITARYHDLCSLKTEYNILFKMCLFVYTKLYSIRLVCDNIIDWILQDFVAMKPIQTSGPFSSLNE